MIINYQCSINHCTSLYDPIPILQPLLRPHTMDLLAAKMAFTAQAVLKVATCNGWPAKVKLEVKQKYFTIILMADKANGFHNFETSLDGTASFFIGRIHPQCKWNTTLFGRWHLKNDLSMLEARKYRRW